MGNNNKREKKAPENYKDAPTQMVPAARPAAAQPVVAALPRYPGFPDLRPPNGAIDDTQIFLIDNAIRVYSRTSFDTDEMKRATKENIVKMIEYYNFRGKPQRVVAHPSKQPHFRLYKLVSIVDKIGPEPWDSYIGSDNPLRDSVAIIELAVDEVAHSSGFDGKFLDCNNLRRGEKYCTPTALPLRAWIISDFKNIQRIEQIVAGSEAKFASIFDSTFEYVLGEAVNVPNFGQPGRGCICGIHGFITIEDALMFIRTGFSGINTMQRLVRSRDLNYGDIAKRVKGAEVAEGCDGSVICMTEQQLLSGVEEEYAAGDVVLMDDM